MKRIVKGTKLKCKNTIFNVFNQVIFEKDNEYDVLFVNNEDIEVLVCINHNLIGNEYNSFGIEWVRKNFEIL